MESFICFIIGMFTGGFLGVVLMAILTANKLSELEEKLTQCRKENAELMDRMEELLEHIELERD